MLLFPQDQWKEKGINPPKPINKVEIRPPDDILHYPFNSRCLISLIVDNNGLPQDIELVHSTTPALGRFCMELVARYRFSPATTHEGKTITVRSNVENYIRHDGNIDPNIPIRIAFGTPTGVRSLEPDPDGVYPLTKIAIPPSMTKFSDEGYGDVVFSGDGSSKCDIVLTISAKAKASDPVVTHCERPALEKPAVESLLKSKYKPGSVNGTVVPIRASIHLEYGDSPAKP
jgi:hypothetical protein